MLFKLLDLKNSILLGSVVVLEIVMIVSLYYAKQRAWVQSDSLVFLVPFTAGIVCNVIVMYYTAGLLGRGWEFWMLAITIAILLSAVALLAAATISFNNWGS